MSPEESAQLVFTECVSVRYRTPSARVAAQQAQVVVDHVAAFHAHERRDLSVGRRPSNVRGRGRQDEVRRVPPHGLVHAVDQRHGAPDREGPGHVTGTKIEKNSASSPPSRMRGTSMLPLS